MGIVCLASDANDDGLTLIPTRFFNPWKRCLTTIISVHSVVSKIGTRIMDI